MVAFEAGTNLNYFVGLYKMTNATTINSTPLLRKAAFKPASGGWLTVDVISLLEPGDYFLCVEETADGFAGILFDEVEGRYCYGTVTSATLTQQIGFGSLAIRMFIDDNVPMVLIEGEAIPTGAGTVTGIGAYPQGQEVTLTAVPNAGYNFFGWSDGVATPSRTVLASNATYTAIFFPTTCNEPSIGNGTTGQYVLPISTYHNYSYTQQIYDASELGTFDGDMNLTSIAFQYIATAGQTKNNITVYVGTTPQTSFSSTTNYVTLANLTQVFSGNLNLNNAQTWFTVDFDQPFLYQGGNLVVAILNNSAGYWSSYSTNTFNIHTTGTVYKTLYYANDTPPSTPLNPASMPAGTRSYNRNNMKFGFCAPPPSYTLNPHNTYNSDYIDITLSPDPIPYGEDGIAYIDVIDDCVYIDNVYLDGEPLGAVTEIPFNFVIDTLPVITVSTAYYQKEVGVTYGPDGTIRVNNEVIPNGGIAYVDCSFDITLQLKPDQGYTVASLTVDGASVPVPASRKYTFTNVQDNIHTIHATFIEYPQRFITMTVEGGIGGAIVPVEREDESVTTTGIMSVDSGTIYQQFLFVPDDHYTIEAVYIDGVYHLGATVSGSYGFANIVNNHTIKVIFKLETYNIFASTGANGTITPAGNVAVPYGVDKMFTIKANTGSVVDQVLIDNAPITVGNELSEFYYTFNQVDANHTIFATFKTATMEITANITGGCGNSSISPIGEDGIIYVPYNTTQIITFVPDEGCKVISVIVDGVPRPDAIPTGSYTFYYVHGPHTIDVIYAKYQYPITATSNGSGIISNPGTTQVDHGDDMTYTFSALQGYKVVNVFVDGINNPAAVAAGKHTFTNVTTAHTISVSFAPIVHTIVAVAEEGGYITPSGNIPVTNGQNQLFTFKALNGYQMDKVLIDGVQNGAAAMNGTYAFLNVTESHTITASFKMSRYQVEAIVHTGGMITPVGITELTYFDAITYHITPDADYKISYVLIDGINMGAIDTYTFSELEANGTIEVFFSPAGEDDPEGINTFDMGISIYSHTNIVSIDTKNISPITDVTIFDMYGRIVWQGNVYHAHNTITLNAAAGIYTVRVTTENGILAKKVNVQK